MTKAKVVELLKAMGENAYYIYEMYLKDGDNVKAEYYLRQSVCYDEAIWLLTDKKYADCIAKVYLKEGVSA